MRAQSRWTPISRQGSAWGLLQRPPLAATGSNAGRPPPRRQSQRLRGAGLRSRASLRSCGPAACTVRQPTSFCSTPSCMAIHVAETSLHLRKRSILQFCGTVIPQPSVRLVCEVPASVRSSCFTATSSMDGDLSPCRGLRCKQAEQFTRSDAGTKAGLPGPGSLRRCSAWWSARPGPAGQAACTHREAPAAGSSGPPPLWQAHLRSCTCGGGGGGGGRVRP